MNKQKKLVNNKSLLLKKNDITKHEISIDPNDENLVMEVYVRDVSFLDIQAAAHEMFVITNGEVSMNLKGYWKFAFSNWITNTTPSLSTDELLSLSGYVGEQISKVLPQPNEIAEALQGGFTTPAQ